MFILLSDFKEKQLLAYNLFVKDLENNCVTHAYLVDENNYSEAFNLVISFVKEILCQNNNNCDNNILCKRIDEGNYPELKIINADGMYIKKQQIIELQQEFSRASVEGEKRIYIIRDCEKMRPEAANSMLKFLEEPENGIIAILMTNNINNVLSTIISRCKIVKLNNVSNKDVLIDGEIERLAFDFIISLENRGLDTLIDIKDIWFSKLGIKDRDKMILALDTMIDIYYDVIKVVTSVENIKFSNMVDKIYEIAKNNKLNCVLEKIRILMEAKDSIKFNVNSTLLIDSIIISIGGVIDDSRN